MLAVAVVLLVVICVDCGSSVAQTIGETLATTQVDELLYRFAEGGKFKMLYDARRRPQGMLRMILYSLFITVMHGPHRMARGVPIQC